jgi:hypothetical protein
MHALTSNHIIHGRAIQLIKHITLLPANMGRLDIPDDALLE